MKDYLLNEATIGNAKVIVDILPKGKVIPNTVIKPTSITIHNTGNIGAAAKNNHNYMKNCNKSGDRVASWHFTVDHEAIYQAIPTNKKAYHAGTSAGNNSSIGIEICMYNDKDKQKKCYDNAIALVKILMKYHGFSISHVKQHYDWSKKDCPTWLRSGKFGYTWTWFKEQCLGVTTVPTNNAPTTVQKALANGSYNKKAKVTASTLNVRKGRPNTVGYSTILDKLPKGTIVTIGYVLNGWASIYTDKAKPGFISTEYVQLID